ncbi:DUF4012 domain-containing protein [Bifidobacterium mongoliense]|uniref:Chemotaxis protein n=2 Tax=Bifidobacterium mongoliense TaxID=518643 RepID=A0A087C7D9_9BIFI|nr:DUF4012 domain-containing protein [Bifidobacterium mongoliense]KFI79189.1 chemotaxis protein [Bifidobacterium mongoliense DSM 21395]MDN6783264.1 DUF4012 domain-containing protein [Bifidobacterium mongoliense]
MSRRSAMGRETSKHGVIRKHGHPLLWSLLCLAIVMVGLLGYAGFRVYGDVQRIKAHERQAIALLGAAQSGGQSLDAVSEQLPKIQQETGAAQAIAHGTMWNLMTHLPVIGDDVVTVQGMTSAVHGVVTDAMPQFIESVSGLKSTSLKSVDGGLNLQPLLDAQSGVHTANQALQRDVQGLNHLPTPRIPMVRDAYSTARDQLGSVAKTADALSNTLNILPGFLGAGQARTYAVMAMTTSEARSAGGLIGSVGEMRTQNGKIAIDDFRANQEYIKFGPGDPTADESRIFNAWGPLRMSFDIRDLAVFPDTSRSAEAMRAIWGRTPWGAGRTLDGVLMMDPVFLQQLIAINGTVKLSNGQVLTGDNTAEFLLNTVYKDYAPAEQDLYFQEVAVQCIGNLFDNVSFEKLSAIGKTMGTMAQQRHFAMYSFDAGMQASLSKGGFTPQTPKSDTNPTVGVYVTQQNPSKMDWYIHRTSKITRTSCNANGSQTYHVEYLLTNTLTTDQVGTLPRYISGVADGLQNIGLEKVLMYAPAGGSLTNLNTTGDVSDARQETMNGSSLQASIAKLAPGASVKYTFDVTTSTKATGDLVLDQTPMGWKDPGITTDTGACTTTDKR